MNDEDPKSRLDEPDIAGDAIGPAPDADGAEGDDGPGSRIEGLLVAGLDRYFAGRHDEAIHVWTRVLFIDRGHARARAYIERARLALAERQREHDALLEHGVAAMGRGDTGAARELLAQSVRDAGPDDRALAALARLDRLEHAAAPARVPAAPAVPRRLGRAARPGSWLPLALILLLSIGAGVFAVGAFGAFGPGAWWSGARPAPAAVAAASAPLPVISTGEAALVRARALQSRGRLREAAEALAVVATDDPRRAEADRLLIEIQDALLATVVSVQQ